MHRTKKENVDLEKLVSRYSVFCGVLTFIFLSPLLVTGQITNSNNQSIEVDYSNPKKFFLGGIVITGTKVLDPNALVLLTGLTVGESINIPGDKISGSIKKLWKQGLFADVQITIQRVVGDKVFLEFKIEEQPRLSRFRLEGASKGEADDIREDINLYRERIVTNNLVVSTKAKIRRFYVDKGYYHAAIDIIQKHDTLFPNHQMMIIKINKNEKVKIEDIIFHGNEEFSDIKLERTFKETKEQSRIRPLEDLEIFLLDLVKAVWKQKGDTILPMISSHFAEKVKPRIFKKSKFIGSQYQADKTLLVQKYKQAGFRDVKIVTDTISSMGDDALQIDVFLEEGNQYFFRNIKWLGNEKYSSEILSEILDIKKGDIYNTSLLDQRLFMNPSGLDVSSQYMDDGYLFFQVTPSEISVVQDSIDIEIKIYEGEQARINKILITGNTKTSEHVIRREIKTKPGDLFSRSDIMRTQRELSILGYLDPEKMNVIPKPNPIDGTVDIEYVVGEKPSDQIELSGGYGGFSLIGTLGLSFNNFSTKNIFNKKAWTPLPSGDGQRLSLRGQTSGPIFNSINFSFTEPWLGGRKPNSFTFYTSYTHQAQGARTAIDSESGQVVDNPFYQSLGAFSVGIVLGKRLKWPDDHFQYRQSINYKYYDVNNWPAFQGFSKGYANDIYYEGELTRSSLDDLNFPKSGSRISLTGQFTPPYSWFNDKDYSTLSTEEAFKYVEYNKWKFTAAWYNNFVDKFVIYAKVGFGGLFSYSPEVGTAPFGRFYLGGSGLSGFQLDAREVIALRGYDDLSLSPATGAPFVTKYTAEIRYPFSTNPSAMVYGLVFAEMGNTFSDLEGFNPFNNYRATGVGIKVFLPMFGLLGLDWGYRLDDVPGRTGMQRSQVHFSIGANLGEL
ncbi:MAG: outer membrane protein insertion porin family [Salibacteraceae bacterium]